MAIRKFKILQLEDDAVRALIFESVVQRRLGQVSTYRDVETALRRLRGMKFDLCIVDLGVYHKDDDYDVRAGLDFVATARGEISRTIPMIIVTSVRDPAALIPCFEAGADDYVVKDEEMARVFTRIRSWVTGVPYTSAYLEQKRREVLYMLRTMQNNDIELI